MAKTLGEFIFEIAKKAGVKEDHPKLIELAQKKELFTDPFDDELDTSINAALISLRDAKNNHTEIRNHYHNQSLLPIDKIITKILDEAELDDNTKAGIIAETSTYKKVPMLLEAIKAAEGKKGVTDKEAQKKYQKQIDDLHAEIRNEKADRAKDKEAFDNNMNQFKLDSAVDRMFEGYKTIYDELDPEVRTMTIRHLRQKELQDNQAEYAFDENNSIVLRKKDGTSFYGKDNQPVTPKAFAESILSKNKILKVTPAPAAGGGNPQNSGGPNPPNGGKGNGQPPQVSSVFKDLMNQAQDDFAKNGNGAPVS